MQRMQAIALFNGKGYIREKTCACDTSWISNMREQGTKMAPVKLHAIQGLVCHLKNRSTKPLDM